MIFLLFPVTNMFIGGPHGNGDAANALAVFMRRPQAVELKSATCRMADLYIYICIYAYKKHAITVFS